jgi:hypothetical protein
VATSLNAVKYVSKFKKIKTTGRFFKASLLFTSAQTLTLKKFEIIPPFQIEITPC